MNILESASRAHSHFRRRAFERHGLKMQRDYPLVLVKRIEQGEGEFIKWCEGKVHRAFYRLEIFGTDYFVLFDFEINALVTIYHKSWFKKIDGEWVEPARTSQKRKQWLNRQERNRLRFGRGK